MAHRTDKVKARLPRGLVDRGPDDIRAVEAMLRTIAGVYERYGFDPVETPLIEYTEALGKFLPDQDRPNEGVFSFQDDDEQWLSLRYDLTAPLARYVAENFERLPKPYRSYRTGWVFRNEKPGPGRFRQFMQCDADTVGTPGVAADAEMAMMMADVMEALGIARGDYVIRVNNRKVLDGYMAKAGLIGEANAGRRLQVLRAIDKLDRLGADAVRELMGPGRLDESGDWTPGANLSVEQIEIFFRAMLSGSVTHYSPATTEGYEHGLRSFDGIPHVADYDGLEKLAADLATTESGSEGARELQEMAAVFDACGYRDRIDIDPSVVRGLEYYTGPVYEAELLAEIPNEEGRIVRFGSVGGGGRYDGLVSRFRGEPVPATGFSIGVSRLATALKNLGKLPAADGAGPVVVLAMDRDPQSLGRYQRMVGALRAAGIRAEMYLGGAGMKAQMKYADRRASPCVVIQGGDERERGEVQIKDLVEGKRLSAEIADNVTWRAQRPAQVSVAEDRLVDTVRDILDAQAADRARGA
ncbi:histidine--tRNA ligase [Aquibium sp. A9E412]|uniref:histidine--tRNA ligase n=1 Tax=Aquibium sp. A9E412 TaxID=2976767 RepID=UPI0025B12E3F|nr:histidine--tRNA ligase [Aquibium sp. A9E412]MDN2566261.1 histidine--tRNA ligase [Aquibium sp. A9E412]